MDISFYLMTLAALIVQFGNKICIAYFCIPTFLYVNMMGTCEVHEW